MGIHGVFKEIGPGQRISLAKLAHDHYVSHARPFRLAIDIAIWLFQIQAGKGGSNPALRTFYYRLLRLLTLNIHPVFVFDGPNKPLFKRNKKVGGPGVRVASVPEFLAKQLLKHFGFPWHVAPGEAEAECALLQREGLVDAVLSEDVDTLMFGSGTTLRNWSTENTSKTPTHVNLYRAEETKEKSGLDREGMILVALMSGGDYVVEGIPGCGPKVACDAARAGFGADLCTLAKRKDAAGMDGWRDRLQHEIKTNQSKYFSRKSNTLLIPDNFPNPMVLGYYTHPCVSTPDKVARLRENLQWDQEIDFPALRSFAADAFDWRCRGGAKKFIRNLAPAMLIRKLRLPDAIDPNSTHALRQGRVGELIQAIHGKRNHNTTDGELEYRVSFIPANFVPIDLDIEDDDDEMVAANDADDQSDAESDIPLFVSSVQADKGEEPSVPDSPSKKRTYRPYYPDQPEKLWVLRDYLKVGCPSMVEAFENPPPDPKEFFKARRQAKAVANTGIGAKAKKNSRKAQLAGPSNNTITTYAKVTKPSQPEGEVYQDCRRAPLKPISAGRNAQAQPTTHSVASCDDDIPKDGPAFKFRSAQICANSDMIGDTERDTNSTPRASRASVTANDTSGVFAAFARRSPKQLGVPRTPQRRKRQSTDITSPASTQRTINSFWSPSPKKTTPRRPEVVDLLSSPADPPARRSCTPTPTNTRTQLRRTSDPPVRDSIDFSPGKLPNTVTKRRKKTPLKRHQTAPVLGEADDVPVALPMSRPWTPNIGLARPIEAIDLASSSPAQGDQLLPDPASLTVPIPGPPPAASRPSSAPPVETEAMARSAAAGLSLPGDSHSTFQVPILASILQHPPTTSHSQQRRQPQQQESAATRPRRSPRQIAIKQRIQLRASLEGSWKEVEAEAIDLCGDESGWKASQGRARMTGWRKSGVEVLDLTGA